MKSFSVVIIGGGPAGSSCAIALANHGVKDILVLEAGTYNKFVIGESIPPNTKQVFNSLGVFSGFIQENHLPCYGVCSYWGDHKRGYNDTVLSPYGHGWHLDRRKFNLFLSKEAQNRDVLLKTSATFKKSKKLDDGSYLINYVCNEEEITVHAKFVVDASGGRSLFAKQQGSLPISGKPLICLARRFKINDATKISSLTRIEATHNGWWYGAKLPNNEMLVAFYTNQETVQQTNIQQVDVWMKTLSKTVSINNGLAELLPIDKKIKGFAVQSFCLDTITGENWLAIGDAASAYDPITSRGIYKSLTDAVFAADCIVHKMKDPLYSFTKFEDYIINNYTNYLIERTHYYTSEQRWKESSFWDKYQKPVYYNRNSA